MFSQTVKKVKPARSIISYEGEIKSHIAALQTRERGHKQSQGESDHLPLPQRQNISRRESKRNKKHCRQETDDTEYKKDDPSPLKLILEGA